MKRIPRRAYGSKIEPNKVVALFCFHYSPYHWFAEAFADLLGVLSRATRVSVHVPANCQLPSVTRLTNQALFYIRNKALDLLVPRDVTIKPEKQHSSFDVHFQQLCNTLLPNNLQIKLFANGYPNRENCESLVPWKFKHIRYMVSHVCWFACVCAKKTIEYAVKSWVARDVYAKRCL